MESKGVDGNFAVYKKVGDVDVTLRANMTYAINEVIVEVNEKGLYEQWREEAVALAEKLGIETN